MSEYFLLVQLKAQLFNSGDLHPDNLKIFSNLFRTLQTLTYAVRLLFRIFLTSITGVKSRGNTFHTNYRVFLAY